MKKFKSQVCLFLKLIFLIIKSLLWYFLLMEKMQCFLLICMNTFQNPQWKLKAADSTAYLCPGSFNSQSGITRVIWEENLSWGIV